jgi:hypothetical protein
MSNSHGSKKKSEGFFSIDRGAFRCAAVGGLNSAIANLILARGTGPDNVTTQWSVNAIEQRTGISRPNADKAVKDLLARGIWKKTRDGLHPIYEAVPGNQVPGGPFTAEEQAVITADDKAHRRWEDTNDDGNTKQQPHRVAREPTNQLQAAPPKRK